MTEWLLRPGRGRAHAGHRGLRRRRVRLVTLDRADRRAGRARTGTPAQPPRARRRCARCPPSCPPAQVGHHADHPAGRLPGRAQRGQPAAAVRCRPSASRTRAVQPVSVAIALVLATAFSMVVGELVPQNLGDRPRRSRTARVVTPFQRVFTAGRPAADPAAQRQRQRAAARGRRRAAGGAVRRPHAAGAGRRWCRRSAEAGTLDASTAQLLTRSLGFAERTAADVMTAAAALHRGRSARRSAADVVGLARTTGHSRFPVIDDDLDDVVGVVHVQARGRGAVRPPRPTCRPPR